MSDADRPSGAAPKINSIVETALYVRDLQVAASFYRRLFEFPTLLESDRLVALDVGGRSVLLLFLIGSTGEPMELTGGVIPPHGATGSEHLAFSIAAEAFEAWRARLSSAGVAVESTMNWPGGARSLYFRDPDEHLVEFITPGFWWAE